MERAHLDELEGIGSISPADVVKPVSAALGATSMAINYFELAPGEQFGYDYHRHRDQEEVFHVLRGTATFETESGPVEVRTGELVRFAPGEFQVGRNEDDERVAALAIGAPADSERIEYRRECPDCGERTIQTPAVAGDGDVVLVTCTACETTVDEVVREN